MKTVFTTLHSKYIHPSLALPCLVAFCRDDCGDLPIREFTVHEPQENVLAELLAEEPQVIAFSVYLWNRRETFDLIDALSAVRPDLRIIVGGPEVSFEGPELFAKHPGLTALVRGEGEIPVQTLLSAWQRGELPRENPNTLLRCGAGLHEGAPVPPLADLDLIPSPFHGGLVEMTRGFVYFETSRGCPYNCAFCMSSLDSQVRSFSMERIKTDLRLLMDRGVPKIKLVDRTFNYDAARSREIFSFILKHNRGSHFHFEIGAHLLDEATLELLGEVPDGLFQFEIGVQSTLPETLAAIDRKASLEQLEKNVRRLRAMGNIHLHLDLIAGLPGEDYPRFLGSIDRVAALAPHHLQVEPVKLLPGAPLRRQAGDLGIRYAPNPPYTVLQTPELSFAELERLRGISRLLDLTFNSGRFVRFLKGLSQIGGSLAAGMEQLESYWRRTGLFRTPLSQKSIFEQVGAFIDDDIERVQRKPLKEKLARDFAHSERVVPGNAPAFFDTELCEEEQLTVKERVRAEQEKIKGQGVKLQHFAAVFDHEGGAPGRTVLLFLYLTETGEGMRVKEILL